MNKNNPYLPEGHKWVETQDGSFTLFSERFQESCHSTNGARQETLLHYVNGCQIGKKLSYLPSLNILEVGFGLGIGFLTTFEFLGERRTPWHFLSLELDEKLLEWFRLSHLDHPFLKNLIWKKENGLHFLEAQEGEKKLTILCGDARKTLPQYFSQFNFQCDAIFQDAFSPKKNPILWTKEWFVLLKNHSQKEVILSTYSSSSSIRKSLIEAGWKLSQGEKFGPKRSSTRAKLEGETDPEILLHLSRSPISAITDENFTEFLLLKSDDTLKK